VTFKELVKRAERLPMDALIAECEEGYRNTLLGDPSPQLKDAGAAARERGYLTRNELIEIAAWKSPRSKRRVRQNSSEDTEAVTETAFQIAAQFREAPFAAAAFLCQLSGVQLPTASTLLTVWDPNDFGIIDIRAWSSLCSTRSGSSVAPKARDYDVYIKVLRQVATSRKCTCREVEMALYAYWDRQQRGGNLYQVKRK
jgi:hypothetical protein